MKMRNLILTSMLALALLSGCATSVSASGSTASSDQTAGTQGASAGEIEIQFADSGVTASARTGLSISGSTLTIQEAGTYRVSGTSQDGSILVQKGTTGVHLVLDGLSLSTQNTAPIVCAKGTEVTIEAAAGSQNTLADTEANNEEVSPDAENAVIKCKDGSQVTLCGAGTLNIQAKGKNGIKSGASTQEDGDASLTVKKLTLNIQAPVNDAINAEGTLNVESGTLTVSAGDDAIHCDGTLNIGAENAQGPKIDITGCCEGLEGATVNIYSGDITIESTDDCINAANAELTGYSYQLNIFGGNITAYAENGDGFDSNGDLTISGGTVSVWTANTADNEPLDADGTVTISGGTVLAWGGSSGMGLNLNAQQPCVIFGTEASGKPGQDFQGQRTGIMAASGNDFTIQDSQGNALLSGTARCGGSYVLYSSPEIQESESYILASGDNSVTVQGQTGTVSSGFGGMGRPGFFRQEDGQPPETDSGAPPDRADKQRPEDFDGARGQKGNRAEPQSGNISQPGESA